jgi:hypothetical protein
MRDPTPNLASRAFALLGLSILVAACSGGPAPAGSAPGGSARVGSATPISSAATTGTPTATTAPSALGSLKHDSPELEALLPAIVARRSLYKWSVRGANFFGLTSPLTPEDLKSIEAGLATEGLALDDVAQAVAGRSVFADPPYFVTAYRFGNVQAEALPRGLGVDNPDAGAWSQPRSGASSWLSAPKRCSTRPNTSTVDRTSTTPPTPGS